MQDRLKLILRQRKYESGERGRLRRAIYKSRRLVASSRGKRRARLMVTLDRLLLRREALNCVPDDTVVKRSESL